MKSEENIDGAVQGGGPFRDLLAPSQRHVRPHQPFGGGGGIACTRNPKHTTLTAPPANWWCSGLATSEETRPRLTPRTPLPLQILNPKDETRNLKPETRNRLPTPRAALLGLGVSRLWSMVGRVLVYSRWFKWFSFIVDGSRGSRL